MERSEPAAPPVDPAQRIRELERELARRESDLRTARAVLRDAQLALPPEGMVGSSPAMRAVHQALERAAPARLPVLFSGAGGTGKELAARALHALSPRQGRPFVALDCAAFPAALAEAELFGSEDRPGLYEHADGGTLFLEDLGELPQELQGRLLRALESSEVRRLGDARVRKVDVRLVASARRELPLRLDALRIALPSLAERPQDIPELVEHFLRLDAARSSRPRKVAPAVLAALCRREWPGNVRELSEEVARLCVLSPGDLEDPALVRQPGGPRSEPPATPASIEPLEALERRAIERAVAACAGDKTRAAELLGISRAKVYQRWKDWHGAGTGA